MGCTVSEPFNATDDPFRFALTAFFVLHDNTDVWPRVIDVVLALMPAATGPVGGAVTVTVTCPQSVVPDEPFAVNR